MSCKQLPYRQGLMTTAVGVIVTKTRSETIVERGSRCCGSEVSGTNYMRLSSTIEKFQRAMNLSLMELRQR